MTRILMIARAKFLVVTAFPLVLSQWANGQALFTSSMKTDRDQANCTPPKNRELFHDYINKEQKNILKSDGKNDNQYTPTNDDQINFLLTRTLIGRIDALQCKIENDSLLTAQNK